MIVLFFSIYSRQYDRPSDGIEKECAKIPIGASAIDIGHSTVFVHVVGFVGRAYIYILYYSIRHLLTQIIFSPYTHMHSILTRRMCSQPSV